MDNIKQCWAFHRDGDRCEHPAGHPGDHTTSTSWTDIECATPGEFGQPATAKTGILDGTEFISQTPEKTEELVSVPITNCVACNHKHKGGACRCGCYEFVG